MGRILLALCVLVALAGGIALGAGPLGEKLEESAPALSRSDSDTAGTAHQLDRDFVAAAAPQVLRSKLSGEAVAIVALPGVSAELIDQAAAGIDAAGGLVATRTKITTGLTRVTEKPLVEALGEQISTQNPEIVDPALTAYPRIGALIAASISTQGAIGAPDGNAQTLRSAFATADFFDNAPEGSMSSLILVLSGSEIDPAIVSGLVEGMATKTKGIVVAGESRDPNIGALRRAETTAGTYDGTDSASGTTSAISLLAGQITQPGGEFGLTGSGGSLPVH